MKSNILFGLLLSFALLFAGNNKAVRMEVETREILENESFELNIVLENFDNNKLSIQQPDFDKDFKRVQGPFQSQSTSIINGNVTKSLTLTYQFLAKRTGDITIPPVIIKDNDQNYQSNSLTLKIVKSGDKATGVSGNNQVFLQASISNTKPYLGEMVKLEYTLYLPANARIRLPSIVEDPRIQGFLVDQKSTNQQARNLVPKIHNGVRYNILLVKSIWLTASSSGKQTIEPLSLKVPIEEAKKKKKRKTAFDDPFFDNDIFSGYNTFNDLIIASRSIPVEIRDLPSAGKPASFSGAVGSFKISSSVSTTTVQTNEAVTIKTVIEGSGNISDISAPKYTIPDDFEIYDPTTKTVLNGSPNSGKLIIEQICIPRVAGFQKITGGDFSFFNPATGCYESANQVTFDINVQNNGNGTAYVKNSNASVNQKDVNLVGSDIRYIKKDYSRLYNSSDKNFSFLNFYLWLLLIITLPGISFSAKLYYNKYLADTSLQRRKKASAFAVKKLKSAIKLAALGNTAEFYQNLETTFYHYLADKFNISHTGIVLEDILTLLSDKGVDTSILDELRDLLNKCASIRYTPVSEFTKDVTSDLEKSKVLINKLEEAIK